MIRSFLIIVSLGAFVFGCGIPEEVHQAKLNEIQQLKKQLGDMNSSNQQLKGSLDALAAESIILRKKLEDLGENVQTLLGEKGALATDLAATREREARLRREKEAQEARMAKYRSVIEKFQKLVTSGKLKIRIVRGRMVVEMASNILFPSGESKLLEEGEEALAELARILQTIDARDFQIAGHTDNVPIHSKRFKSNWDLSTARAVTVVNFLQENGVEAKHLSASGYAEYQPAADNNTEDGRAENRRIEIVLMPNLDELPDLSGLGVK